MVEEEQEGSALKRKNKRDERVEPTNKKRAEKRQKRRIKKEEQ